VLVSILIPVFNERTVVEASLQAVLQAPLPEHLERELIVVDDCSTDGTWEILQRLAQAESRIKLHRHEINQGKGAAVRTAVAKAEGDFALIQDADLEYDPSEYPILLRPLLDGHADAVFGSRYLVREQRRVLPFWHTVINKCLTTASNMFANVNLTDMETCYKVFRTDLLKSIPIRSNRFGIEPEITMKAAKRRLRIYEVPISYHGRSHEEGKKIGWWDGLQALGVILKFWLIDDLYAEPYGKGTLVQLTRTPAYLKWVTSLIRPALGDSVFEAGAGTGTLTGLLMGRRARYTAWESEPLYLHALRNRFLRTPNVEVTATMPESAAEFDTALALNVLEGQAEPGVMLARLAQVLKSDGNLVVLAPNHPALFGSVDRSLGQLRRFSQAQLVKLLADAGFVVEDVRHLNKAAVIGWWLNSRVFGSRRVSKVTLKIFDKTLWFWRLIDKLLPWGGLSLLIFARKKRSA